MEVAVGIVVEEDQGVDTAEVEDMGASVEVVVEDTVEVEDMVDPAEGEAIV